MANASELNYDTSASALDMANSIFGDGVTVLGASFSGDSRSSAIYSGGDALAPGTTPSDEGVILSTGFARSFTNSFGDANQSGSTSTNTFGVNDDAQFNALAGTRTLDAAILEVDFIPDSDTLTMQFVFSSEEFPEFTTSQFQDMVGVWVNGQPVQLAVGDGDIDPSNLSALGNANLLTDNTPSVANTEMDAFTVTMTLKMDVVPGVQNSIRIGIADVTDSNYDSNLLIAGDSVQTALIAQDDAFSITPDGARTIDVLGNDTGPSGSTLTITHINGQAVAAGDTVTLNTGQQVTLNADGTFTVQADSDVEDINFTYEVQESGSGITDVAFVSVSSIPCFLRGTAIRTPRGKVPVERLRAGDLVDTLDHGAQPIRWIGRRAVPGQGRFAPVRVLAGTFGARHDLFVSPQHRLLICDPWSELMFGEREVLVAARDLVNDRTVRQVESADEVEYFHVLFDAHQIVFSEGVPTESFHPGPQVASMFERRVLEEICALFPELDPETGEGYGATARLSLKSYEAGLLAARVV
ncbi:2,3,4,5-tetrahydropyridine-2,6-carboxylate N-succinyltransferase [Maritimibacter sp. 55A14]|uniref:Hint domain-containing protein n=1 Tax=Maritimibacter sp. 55A14 TaxID=2174844 RepID=UPI000D615366|nr:Hint domain-containing protein [Maritimibacter sp. 55A14]PWE32677.1 2,3,4,5-tetrahydropyridine-2,6-carboxylate N-succinyltransferase [Maritimibacter sp. 55A14]